MAVESVIMLAAVALWWGVSALSRLAGAVVGTLLSVGMGGWAWMVLAQGGRISVLGWDRPLPAPAVLGAVAVLLLLNLVTLLRCLAGAARRGPAHRR